MDAVTIDAYGTLVQLDDRVPGLRAPLAERGHEATDDAVRAAFAAEVAYYAVDPDELPFVASPTFDLVPGGREACDDLSRAGLRLCVVSNWDIGLSEHLQRTGVADPARAVQVGDDPADEAGALAAGLRFEPAPLAEAAQRILA